MGQTGSKLRGPITPKEKDRLQLKRVGSKSKLRKFVEQCAPKEDNSDAASTSSEIVPSSNQDVQNPRQNIVTTKCINTDSNNNAGQERFCKTTTTSNTGINIEGNISGDQVVVAQITGSSNVIHMNQTIAPRPIPERIEFNFQDCVESFTGREDIVKLLHDDIEKNKLKGIPTVLSQTQIISGMGGVGKTETVRKYIQLYKSHYGHTLWINAESYSEARSCFLKLASIIHIAILDFEGKPKDDDFIAEEVYNVVCMKPSLIVFDNAQSMERNDLEEGIKPWLPKTLKTGWQTPAIIVTTRDRKWNQITTIELKGFNNDECYTLLISQLHFPDTEDNRLLANEIADLCEGLPLVIQQVIAVILEEAEVSGALFKNTYGMREFISEVQNDQANFIHAKPADSPVGESVATIFEITFRRLATRKNGKLALKCLSVMSLLNPDIIPAELLEHLVITKDKRQLAEAMNLLHRFNLSTRCEGFYKVHRMIQAVTLNSNVFINAEEKQNFSNATISLFNEYLKAKPNNASNMPEILDNGIRLFKISKNLSNKNGHIEFYETLADKLDNTGRYKSAIETYVYIHEKQKIELGKNNPKTITAERNLASAFRKQGEYEKAEQLYHHIIQIQTKTLGPKHPDTLMSESGLAHVYQNNAKYEEAEKLYVNVLHNRTEVLGPNNATTMITKNDLAIVYNRLEKYEKAEELILEALEYLENNFGSNYPDTLTTKHNLSSIYRCQGKYAQAEELAKDVLLRREKVLGPNHPHTITTKGQLATIYVSTHKYEVAEEMLQEMYEVEEKLLGRNHPNTIETAQQLVNVYILQDKYNEAGDLYQTIFADCKIWFDPDNSGTLAMRSNMGFGYIMQGKYKQAEELYQQIIPMDKKILGPNHPTTLISINNVGVVYRNQGKYKQAELIFQELIQTQEKVLGENHCETLRSKNHLGTVYCKLGEYQKAADIYINVLQMRETILGATHSDTLITKNNLAVVHTYQGKHAVAEKMFLDIIETRLSLLGENHKDTITSKKDLAVLYEKQGKYSIANELLQHILPISEKILGLNHPDTLTIRHNLAVVYQGLEKYANAKELYEDVLHHRNVLLGSTHPDTLATENNLDAICQHKEKLMDNLAGNT